MEETTRAFAVLAALTLALAPVTNGVLEEAARTADRVILDPADWDAEPPEDPPDDPPEDPPEDLEGNESFEAPAGAQPTCPVETEPVAGWYHPADDEERQTPPNRTTDPREQGFEVTDEHLGVGVALDIANLTGELSASLQNPDGDEMFSYEHPAWTSQQDDVNRTSTIPREELDTGTWTVDLTHRTATYDELRYVIVTASCAEEQG